MTRLGLTQRVDVVESYRERRDCLDQAWTDLLESWDYQPVPLPNTVSQPTDYLDSMNLDGVVFTGGNDLSYLDGATKPAPERDEFEHAALRWAVERSIPVVGVCRGLEFINHYFGGELSPIRNHVATEHPVSFGTNTINLPANIHKDDQFFIPNQIKVNSYHDYGLTPSDVADELCIFATASDGTVEAIVHPEYPLLGIMWHPERQTPSTAVDQKLFDALFICTD